MYLRTAAVNSTLRLLVRLEAQVTMMNLRSSRDFGTAVKINVVCCPCPPCHPEPRNDCGRLIDRCEGSAHTHTPYCKGRCVRLRFAGLDFLCVFAPLREVRSKVLLRVLCDICVSHCSHLQWPLQLQVMVDLPGQGLDSFIVLGIVHISAAFEQVHVIG